MRLLRLPGIEVSINTGKLPRTTLAPLRKGSCQRKLTEGSFFQWRTDTAADTFIEVSRPVTYGKTGTAGDRWSPLRVKIGSGQDRGNSHHGKLC